LLSVKTRPDPLIAATVVVTEEESALRCRVENLSSAMKAVIWKVIRIF
jgi:hypothetical protein